MKDIFKDRKSIMKQWDRWRKYIADGGGGSWPRDAFESLLDYYDEKLNASQSIPAQDVMRCEKCGETEPVLYCENCGHTWPRL